MYQDYLNKIVTLKDKYRQSPIKYYFRVVNVGQHVIELRLVMADDEIDAWWSGYRSVNAPKFVKSYEIVSDDILGLLYE